ncbi:MAG: mercury resistance system periplasmic binding protein MerP [Gammaproteobacteria bacterium]
MTLRAKSSALIAVLLVSSGVLATEKTVTLKVDNMYCASCGPVVRKSLARIGGVTKVEVSQEEHSAIVTFDDVKTGVAALIEATTNAGYPSRLAQ